MAFGKPISGECFVTSTVERKKAGRCEESNQQQTPRPTTKSNYERANHEGATDAAYRKSTSSIAYYANQATEHKP